MKSSYITIDCPNCKKHVNVPYIEPIGIPFRGEIDREISRAWTENALRIDEITVREYDEIIKAIDEEEAEVLAQEKGKRLRKQEVQMNWRPKNWSNPWGETLALSPNKQTQYLLDNIYETGAMAMLETIIREIAKVENIWLNKDIVSEGEYAVLCYNREKGFEECRQKILNLINP